MFYSGAIAALRVIVKGGKGGYIRGMDLNAIIKSTGIDPIMLGWLGALVVLWIWDSLRGK